MRVAAAQTMPRQTAAWACHPVTLHPDLIPAAVAADRGTDRVAVIALSGLAAAKRNPGVIHNRRQLVDNF